MSDILDCEQINQYIKTDQKIHITVLDEVESTNSFLKCEALKGAAEGTVVIASSQTSGRGRFARKFHSPEGSGIYMSVLLRPSFSGFEATLVTTAAAVAVAEAIESLSENSAQIKWVNDILVSGKKVCGILTEGAINALDGQVEYVVLGIGVNAYEPEGGFADEIADIAAAVFRKEEPNLRNRLAAEIINRFMNFYDKLEEREYIKKYRSRCMALGEKIIVLKNGQSRFATALDIDDNCRLLVQYDDSSKEYLSSGEISIKFG